ncbi:MAG: helix-turn-helix domain-containing protein [Verrucomicrobia bacterium]|nr:helix-turn-helix domain-containing protein [Verrucomicrobiota bacterium]
MARTRRSLDARGEGAQVLAALRSGKMAGWQHEGLLALKWGLEGGVTLEQVAQRLGRARSCIQGWYERFRQRGLAGLLRRDKAPGRPSQLSPELQARLRQQLKAGRFRRATDAHQWLKAQGGVQLRLKSVYYHLKKIGRALESASALPSEKGPLGRRGLSRNLDPGAGRTGLAGR